jgi:hypothetical protein
MTLFESFLSKKLVRTINKSYLFQKDRAGNLLSVKEPASIFVPLISDPSPLLKPLGDFLFLESDHLAGQPEKGNPPLITELIDQDAGDLQNLAQFVRG